MRSYISNIHSPLFEIIFLVTAHCGEQIVFRNSYHHHMTMCVGVSVERSFASIFFPRFSFFPSLRVMEKNPA
jgi:hypothetical protein